MSFIVKYEGVSLNVKTKERKAYGEEYSHRFEITTVGIVLNKATKLSFRR